MTGSPAHFWEANRDECDRIMGQHIDANLVLIQTACLSDPKIRIAFPGV